MNLRWWPPNFLWGQDPEKSLTIPFVFYFYCSTLFTYDIVLVAKFSMADGELQGIDKLINVFINTW